MIISFNYHTYAGKLPIVIEVDSNVIPQLQAVVLNSEEPPPIPPKIFKIE